MHVLKFIIFMGPFGPFTKFALVNVEGLDV